MKLLIFINSLEGGGAERIVQTISNYLTDKLSDMNIVLVTLDSGTDIYDIHPRINRYNLKLGFLNRSIGKILFLPFQAWEFSRVVRKEKPDAVISFLVRANLVNVFSRFFGNGQRIYISERNTTNDFYNSQGLRGSIMIKLMRWLYPKADHVLAISGGVKKNLETLGVEAKKIKIIHNPQDLNFIKKQSLDNCPIYLENKHPIIVTAGRLMDQKDHVTLLEAFSKVRKELETTLVIIGDGPKREQLKKKAKSLGIYKSVIFAGWQSNPYSIMKQCDLFVLSSKIEGFGNVVVEAMCCGLPIVSTSTSGPREILNDGKSGLIVPVGDSETLGKAILKMLKDINLRSYYSKMSIKRAEDFSVKKIIPQYLEFLNIDIKCD